MQRRPVLNKEDQDRMDDDDPRIELKETTPIIKVGPIPADSKPQMKYKA